MCHVNEFESLISEIRDFAERRDWGKFHSPKNLAMAVAGESGELVSEFQWLTELESRVENLDSEKLQAIKMEIADVAIYLFRLADVLGVDIPKVMREKIEFNETRF